MSIRNKNFKNWVFAFLVTVMCTGIVIIPFQGSSFRAKLGTITSAISYCNMTWGDNINNGIQPEGWFQKNSGKVPEWKLKNDQKGR